MRCEVILQDPTVRLCLGTYGDPMGVGVSYERGTPVGSLGGACSEVRGNYAVRGDSGGGQLGRGALRHTLLLYYSQA